MRKLIWIFLFLATSLAAAEIIELEDGTDVYIDTIGQYTTYSYPDRTVYYDVNWEEVKTGWYGTVDYIEHPDAEFSTGARNYWREEFTGWVDAGGYSIAVHDTSDIIIRQLTPVLPRASLTDLNDYGRILAEMIFQNPSLTIKNNGVTIYPEE